MKPIKDIPYLLFMVAGATFFFGFRIVLALVVDLDTQHKTPIPWICFQFVAALICFAIGVFSLRARGLGYSATIENFGGALRGKPRPPLVNFNHANAHLIRSSLFIYLVATTVVWATASFIAANPITAFLITIAAFIATHTFRIAQLKKLPGITIGSKIYAGSAILFIATAYLVARLFFYILTITNLSLKEFWLVTACLALISCMSVHADFVIAKLLNLNRPT